MQNQILAVRQAPKGRQQASGTEDTLVLTPQRTDCLGILPIHWAPFLQAQAGASLLAAQGHCFPQPHSEASCLLHRPWS